MNYRITRTNEFLSHHGILGQKWGVQNGPPYPIDAEDHSAYEKKVGWKKSLDAKRENRRREKNQERYRSKFIKKIDDPQSIKNTVKSIVSEQEVEKLASLKKDYTEALSKIDRKVLDNIDNEIDKIFYSDDLKKYYPEWAKELSKSDDFIEDDYLWSEVFDNINAKVWSKYPKEKALNDYADEKIEQFINESKRITDNIVGSYGSYTVKERGPIRTKDGQSFSSTDWAMRLRVQEAIEGLSDDFLKRL